jgi:3-methylcrotonyl-CoA carboxylase alpha subunit
MRGRCWVRGGCLEDAMIRLRCGDDLRTVEVRPHPEGLEVTVDGATHRPRVSEAAPGVFVLEEGSRREAFHCVRAGGRIHLFWRGASYLLEEVSESERTAQRHRQHGLEAPMPGKVIAVKVAPGQAVRRGDELLVVEAMKMENAVRAPRDGVVRAVRAEVGQMVGPGEVLAEMEE